MKVVLKIQGHKSSDSGCCLRIKGHQPSEAGDKGGGGYAKNPHRFPHLTPTPEDLGIKPTSKSTTEASFLIRDGRLSGNKKVRLSDNIGT